MTHPPASSPNGNTSRSSCRWYRDDALARELSQLDEQEIAKFEGSALVDVRPVIVPHPEHVVGANDYFMWPIATMVDGTMVVLYARTPCHWGKDSEKRDANSGIRMIITSADGGHTWREPLDVLQAGRWDKSPFTGFGAGLGVHDGVVYLALNQGVYRSPDKGLSWELVSQEPVFADVPDRLWGPGMRITFDAEHGLTIWTTAGFGDYEARSKHGKYGTHLCAVYSPDYGTTWHYEEQVLPDGIRLSEVTPLQFDGKIAFFLRNGLRETNYGQGFSATGWFPFTFALSNVGPVGIVDTPDVAYNPVTQRLEAAASHRHGRGPGPGGRMKVNLYSITPEKLAAGNTDWRFDGTLIRYTQRFGKSDGFNPVGTVIDTQAGKQYVHVWGGDCTGRAAIYQYSRSLQTDAVREYLTGFYKGR